MSKETKIKSLPKRSEIAKEMTWRLEDIFPTDEAWEKEYEEIKEQVKQAGQYKGTIGESASQLNQVLQFQSQVFERLGKLYTYAHMRYDQDTGNSHYQGLNSRAESLYSIVASEFSYVVPEILAMDESKIAQFIEENTDLQVYRHASCFRGN